MISSVEKGYVTRCLTINKKLSSDNIKTMLIPT